MAVVKNLMVRAGADFSGLIKPTKQVQKTIAEFKKSTTSTLEDVGKRVSGIMKNIVAIIATIGIGKAIKDSIKDAMEVEAAINQIKRVMGESSNQFLKWANDSALAFGMSKGEAIKFGAVYGNLISGFSKNTAEAMKYTQDLLKASAIIASSTGRTMEDVMSRIRSGLLGNTEAIEDLGVNVNVAMIQSTDAFKRFANGKSWQQLSFQAQQQIRLMAILEQTNKKYGDSVSNNTSFQLQQLVAVLKNVQLSLGQAFMPILQIILPALTALANQLAYVMNIVAQFSQALFGKGQSQAQAQTKATIQQAGAVNDLGDAYTEAGKKAKGSLASFDEINSIDNGSGAGGGAQAAAAGGGAATMPTTPINFKTNAPEISKSIQDMANKVRGSIVDIMQFIENNKAIIISIAGGIGAAFAAIKLAGLITSLSGLSGVLAALASPAAIIGVAIAALTTAFLYLYQTNEQFRASMNAAWTEIGTTITDFWNNTLIPIGDYFIYGFCEPIGAAIRDNILPVLSDVFVGSAQILNDLLNYWITIFNNIWGVVQPALELLKKIIIDALGIIKSLWDQYGQALLTNSREFIKGLTETVQLIWDNILNPIIKPFLEMLSWLWDNHLKALVEQVGEFILKLNNGAMEIYNGFIKPLVDWLVVTLGPTVSNVINTAVDVIGSMVGGISDIAEGLFKALGGIVDFITGVFTGNWTKAWQGVKDVFGGVFDSLVGLVKTPLNYIIDAINFVIRGLNSLSISIPDWVPDWAGGGQTWGINIPQIPKLATGGITDVNNPFLAMVGDNKTQREVVSPLGDLMDMIQSAVGTAVVSAMQFTQGNNNQGGDVVLQIDGTTLARVMNPYTNKESDRIGTAFITET